MKFLATALLLGSATHVATAADDEPTPGRGAVWSKWSLHIGSDLSAEFDNKPVSTLFDERTNTTRVGYYGDNEPLEITTVEGDGEYDNLSLSRADGIVPHVLALDGDEDVGIRPLIDIAFPEDITRHIETFEYEGFGLADSFEDKGALCYYVTWNGSDEWYLYPAPQGDSQYYLARWGEDVWTTADYVPVKLVAKLRAQS